MAVLDKEIRVIALKGQQGNAGTDGIDGIDGKSSYELAVENELFSGTLEEWIETFATPENYITRTEFQKVTQAQYDAMEQAGTLVPNCYYLIIDDTTAQDFEDLKNDTIINNAKHLYRHIIELQGTKGNDTYGFVYTLYTNNNTPITTSNIYDYFDNGTNYQYINANGVIISSNVYLPIYWVGIKHSGVIAIFYLQNDTTNTLNITDGTNTITDNITQIF